MDWSGVDYCDVFISCLDSHSDGTHSLQRIHWWASDGMLHFSKSDEETNSSPSWMPWGWGHFLKKIIFGWTTPLKTHWKVLWGTKNSFSIASLQKPLFGKFILKNARCDKIASKNLVITRQYYHFCFSYWDERIVCSWWLNQLFINFKSVQMWGAPVFWFVFLVEDPVSD